MSISKYKSLKIILITVLFSSISMLLSADENPKASIKSNGVVIYYEKQKEVDTFADMFLESNINGRLRSNNFYFRWNNEDIGHADELVNGLGASIVMQSAKYENFDFLLGLYASYSYFDTNDKLTFFKSSKDTFSRYQYAKDGDKHMLVLGQANINYTGFKDTGIRIGRQFVETFYTKSNDTKMIPNTFDGGVLSTKLIPKTTLQIAYLAKQKLRDHTTNHSVLMYDNSDIANYSMWDGNDDSAMHKGLTYTALKAAGKPTDSPLIIIDFKNESVKNLKIDGSFYNVPELLSQGMLEFNYKFNFDGFSVTPGFRYIRQFDDGAGDVGGASLSGKVLGSTDGYKTPNSLNSQMVAARIVTKIDDYKINLAYTNILDEADLVTPWRGFPTAGYTRSMGIYNWRANTKSYRLELVRNPNKDEVYRDIFVQASVLFVDSDEDKKVLKIANRSDYLYYYIGFVQNIPSLPEVQWRFRIGYAKFLDSPADEFNYMDSRFELNYLF